MKVQVFSISIIIKNTTIRFIITPYIESSPYNEDCLFLNYQFQRSKPL